MGVPSIFPASGPLHTLLSTQQFPYPRVCKEGLTLLQPGSESVLETEFLTFVRICFTSGIRDEDNLMMLREAGLLAEAQPVPGVGCSGAGLHHTRLEFWLVPYEMLTGPPSLDPDRMAF